MLLHPLLVKQIQHATEQMFRVVLLSVSLLLVKRVSCLQVEIALQLVLPTAKLAPPPYFVQSVNQDFSKLSELLLPQTLVLP